MTRGADSRYDKLLEDLQRIEAQVNRAMLRRGFDPAQVETTALPEPLSILAAERARICEELDLLRTEDSEMVFEMNSVEIKRIEDQLRRAFEGGAWHGPAVLEVLRDVDARAAAAHPISNAHSIWELVLHIAAWEGACRRRLEGDRAQLSDEEDWPAVTDTSESAWQAAKETLAEGHRELRKKILALDESRLDQPVMEGLSSVYITIHGALQHDLYHAGQIAILKKAVAS